MNTKILVVLGVLLSFVIGFFAGRMGGAASLSSLVTLDLGIQTSPAMALPMIAKDKGFFEKHGLQVTIQEFTAGKFALEALLSGSLDLAVSGDVPALLAALQGNKVHVLAQVVDKTINEVRVVARKDSASSSARDFFTQKKRKLATSFGGGPEFFTYEFLNKLGITKDQVEIVSQKPGDMPAALISRSVDAIAIFDPFAFIAEKQLGAEAVTFTDPSVYSELYVLEASEALLERPEVLYKILKALIDAESFARVSPKEAQQIVVKYTKLDEATVSSVWGSFDFRVSLTKQLLEFWRREILWAQATEKISKDTPVVPVTSILFDGPLRKVAPKAVSL